MLFPVDGGAPQAIRFLDPADDAKGFADSHSVLVTRSLGGGAVQVTRVNLTTGVRTPVRVITRPREALGFTGGDPTPHLTPDGQSYIYGLPESVSTLYLVTSVR